jgi:hypothetical protein
MHNALFRRNGEITHSGFVNDVATELWSFNGRMNYSENVSSSEKTSIALSYKNHLNDVFETVYHHNGKIRRNGAIQHTRSIRDVITLTMKIFGLQDTLTASETNSTKVKLSLQDIMPASEKVSLTVTNNVYETLHRRIRRNGQYNRATGVVDVQNIDVHVSSFTDTMPCPEGMTIWYKKHYKHNGRFRRNGMVKHDSNVRLPLED